MSELTDRYVSAVVKDVPGALREDAERRLRETIAERLAAAGSTDEAAERRVLEDLGDPADLALEYGAAKRYVIGPDLYPLYVRLLRTLLVIVPPIVFAVVLAVELWRPEGRAAGAVGEALSSAVQTGIGIAFWVTLVFALLERAGVRRHDLSRQSGKSWSVDSLPPPTGRRQITLAEFVPSVTFLVLLVVAIWWQRSHSVVFVNGEPVPFLNPALWDWWIPAFLGLIAVLAAIEVWKYVTGRWTLPLVIVNVAANALFGVFVVALFQTREVVNPAFTAAVTSATGADIPSDAAVMAVVILILVLCVWDSADSILKYMKAG